MASQALNGIQITALRELVTDVAAGKLTMDSARALIAASFPSFDAAQIAGLLQDAAPVAA